MNMTQIIAAGALGALRLLLSLGGGAIPLLTGIPGSAGFVNVMVAGMFYSLTTLVIGRFGAATLMGLVFGILAIPLPLSGPPGFLPKILVNATIGLLADIAFFASGRRQLVGALVVGAVTQMVFGFELGGLLLLFGVPGAEEAARIFFLPQFVLGAGTAGGVAGGLAWLIFSRLRNSFVVKRLQK